MASKEFNVIAIIHPKQGKTDRVVELLKGVAQYVRANEPGTLKYEINRVTRPSKDGTEDIVMIERYKDQQSLREHGTSSRFVEHQKTVTEENLMRAPTLLKIVAETGSGYFSSRL